MLLIDEETIQKEVSWCVGKKLATVTSTPERMTPDAVKRVIDPERMTQEQSYDCGARRKAAGLYKTMQAYPAGVPGNSGIRSNLRRRIDYLTNSVNETHDAYCRAFASERDRIIVDLGKKSGWQKHQGNATSRLDQNGPDQIGARALLRGMATQSPKLERHQAVHPAPDDSSPDQDTGPTP